MHFKFRIMKNNMKGGVRDAIYRVSTIEANIYKVRRKVTP